MEADLHLIGAMDTLSGATFTEANLLTELQARGLNEADAALLVERGVLLGLLVRDAPGTFTRGPESLRRERLASEPPATQ